MLTTNAHQQTLDKINVILSSHSSLLAAYSELETILLGLFSASRMSIFQRRRQHQDLVARFKTGKETTEIKVPISPLSIAGYVALAQLPAVIADPYNTDELQSIHPRLRFADKFDKTSAFKTENILCIPILNAGVLLGVMQIINKKTGSFDGADLKLAQQVAEILGNKFRYELGGTANPFDSLLHQGLINDKALSEILKTSQDHRQAVQRLMSEYRLTEAQIGNSLSTHYQVPFFTYQPDKYHLYQTDSKLNLSYLKRNFVAVIPIMRRHLYTNRRSHHK